MFGLPIIIVLIHSVLLLTCFHIETPTFLLKVKETQVALRVMSRLYYYQEIEDSDDYVSSDLNIDQEPAGFKDLFMSLKNNKTLRMGCVLSSLQQLTGINFLIVTSANVFPSQKGPFTLVLGLVNCVTGSFGIFLLKKHYKKNLMIGALGMCLCYICIIVLTIIKPELKEHVSSYIYISICMAFIACFELSVGPIMWIYCADILCERGIAITSSTNWVCASIVVGVFGFAAEKSTNDIYERNEIFIPFNCISLFFCACVFVM